MVLKNHSLQWLRRASAAVAGVAALVAGVGIANAVTVLGTPGYMYQRLDANGQDSLVGIEAWKGSDPAYCIGTSMATGHATGPWQQATSPNELIAAEMVKEHLNAVHDDLTQAAVSYAIKDHLDTHPAEWNAIKNTPLRGGDINAVRSRAAQYWNDAAAHTPTSASINVTPGHAQGTITAAVRSGRNYVSGVPWRVSYDSRLIHIDGATSGTTGNGPIKINWHATGYGRTSIDVFYAQAVAKRQAAHGSEQPLLAPDPGQQWEPLNAEFRVDAPFHLNENTTAMGQSPKAGSTSPVHDRIVSSINRGEQWSGGSVKLNVWLNWDGYPATTISRKAVSKQVTISGTGTVNSPDFTPADFGWQHWAPGRYWFDISAGKQGNMASGVNTSDRQSSETFNLPPLPTKKTLTRMNGQPIDGQLAPGTQYMSHITGTVTPTVTGYNTQATITDHIQNKNIWVGAADHDDLSKVTVTHNGATVTSGVHVSKTPTSDGYDVIATIANPGEGEYTLNVPSTIKALSGDGKDKVNETIKDKGCVVANTGASSVCSDVKQQPGEHPETSKAWQLKNGKLVDDPTWSNHVGADTLTFLPGDPISAIVTGNIPGDLLENLDRYELTDNWSDASRYVDFSADAANTNHKVSVFVDGADDTNEFSIHEDASAHTVTAVAKPAFLARTKSLSKNGHRAKVQLMITGTFRSDYRTGGNKESMVNKGSQQINTEGRETNVPSVFTWTPNPNKEWARNTAVDGSGTWVAVTDSSKTDRVNGDGKYYREADPLAALVNGTVPTGLGYAPTSLVLTEDYSKNAYYWKPDVSKARVYEANLPASDDAPDASYRDITTKGTDESSGWKVSVNEHTHTITATITAAHARELKGLSTPRQITLLVPGMIKLAHGKGATQVREDYGATTIAHRKFVDKNGSEFYQTCYYPNHSTDTTDKSNLSKPILNDGSETAGTVTVKTNEPPICVTVPEPVKSVQAEKSQGGDQHDGDGQKVRPNQRIEYNLSVTDHIPDQAHEAYAVENVSLTDRFSDHATVDAQTVEVKDEDGDDLVSGKDYTVNVDNTQHTFTVSLSKEWISSHYKPGDTVRLRVRFEAQLDDLKDCGASVENAYEYKVNNGITASNKVTNNTFCPVPKKHVTQTNKPSVDINGKRLLLGDRYDYRLTLDATSLTQGTSTKNADGTISRKGDQLYRVQRLGMTDTYDAKHLSVDPKAVRVLDQNGNDVTAKFNIAVENHVLYVFAKTVDTPSYAGLGTIKGDPQPKSLAAYATAKLDKLRDPYIDQSLLGQTYTIVMPTTVTKVEQDGIKVTNQAVQIVDDQQYFTNLVTNELKKINPKKDVVINVGQASANGKSIYKGHYFLYRLQSSKRPSDLAYPVVTDWHITDQLDPTYDRYTGQWAVYADTDIKASDGTEIAKAGQKIAGSNWTPSAAIQRVLTDEGASSLFTVQETTDHLIQVTATPAYKVLVSDGKQDAQWSAYIQVQRMKPVEHHNNQFNEYLNGTRRPSNTVWTRTPDQTPKITLEKYDVASGLKDGDRNEPAQALSDAKDGTKIGFKITNTGKSPITKITLSDQTIAGSGTVQDIDLTPLKNLTLQPGQSVTVYGTLRGVKDGDHHTDRSTTTGKPLLPCAVPQPGLPDTSTPEGGTTTGSDQPQLCEDTPVHATDDWNGERPQPQPLPQLPHTGATIAAIAGTAVLLLSGGFLLVTRRKRTSYGMRNHTAAHAV